MMKSHFLKITYLISLLLVSSSIYINTYWSGFEIDFFPYIQIEELLMYSLSPLIKVSIPVIIGLIFAFLFLDRLFPFGGYEDLKKQEKETGKKITSNIEKGLRRVMLIIFFVLYPILLLYNFITDIDKFYSDVPFIFALFSASITNKLLSYGIILNSNIDYKVIVFSTFLLISSFTTAKLNSKKIYTNKEFKYILNNKEYLKIVGKGGDYYFLKSLNNEKTVILKNDKINGLSYYHFKGKLNTKKDSIINQLIEK